MESIAGLIKDPRFRESSQQFGCWCCAWRRTRFDIFTMNGAAFGELEYIFGATIYLHNARDKHTYLPVSGRWYLFSNSAYPFQTRNDFFPDLKVGAPHFSNYFLGMKQYVCILLRIKHLTTLVDGWEEKYVELLWLKLVEIPKFSKFGIRAYIQCGRYDWRESHDVQ